MPVDNRADRLFDGYDPIGSVAYRLDVLLSNTGGVYDLEDEVDASVANCIAQDEYTFDPGSGLYVLHRLCGVIEDSPTVNLGTYGDSELTNGIIIAIKNSDDTVKHQFTTKPLTRIADWALLLGPDLPEADRQFVAIRWTMAQAGVPVTLDGEAGEYFSFNCVDAATGLVTQHLHLQGFQITTWGD